MTEKRGVFEELCVEIEYESERKWPCSMIAREECGGAE